MTDRIGNGRPLYRDNTRSIPRANSVEYLITVGLGYCCLWRFFSWFRQTHLIADRLGVTSRAIRKHKERFRAGELSCENCRNCMRKARVSGK